MRVRAGMHLVGGFTPETEFMRAVPDRGRTQNQVKKAQERARRDVAAAQAHDADNISFLTLRPPVNIIPGGNMHPVAALTLFAILHLHVRAKAADVDDYLKSEPEAPETAPAFEMPAMKSQIKGVVDDIPQTRTREAMVEELRQNQSKLTQIFKRWKMKEAEGVNRHFGLSITIDSNGTVTHATVKGVENKDFSKEVEENIKTWNFSRVREKTPKTAAFKNLDFLYKKERLLEN